MSEEKKIDYDALKKEILTQVGNVAGAVASKYVKETTEMAKQILEQLDDNLRIWLSSVAKGEIDKDTLEVLIKSYKVELQMAGLTAAGMAQLRAYELAKVVLLVIVDVALRFIPK